MLEFVLHCWWICPLTRSGHKNDCYVDLIFFFVNYRNSMIFRNNDLPWISRKNQILPVFGGGSDSVVVNVLEHRAFEVLRFMVALPQIHRSLHFSESSEVASIALFI